MNGKTWAPPKAEGGTIVSMTMQVDAEQGKGSCSLAAKGSLMTTDLRTSPWQS